MTTQVKIKKDIKLTFKINIALIFLLRKLLISHCFFNDLRNKDWLNDEKNINPTSLYKMCNLKDEKYFNILCNP